MRAELLKRGQGQLPTTFQEMLEKIKLGKGKQKGFWVERAAELTNQFKLQFNFEKVARKWQTLTTAYIKARQKNSSTGNDPSKFEYISEMEELIGARHDISFPVTASASGITIHRPDQVDLERKEYDEAATSAPLPPCSKKMRMTPSSCGKKRRAGVSGELMEMWRKSDEQALEAQKQMLGVIKSGQESFERMFMALLAKKDE